MTREKFEDLTQFLKILNDLLPDLGEHNVMSKMLELETRCIFAKFDSKVKFMRTNHLGGWWLRLRSTL
jgi:hypothetical protein